MTNSFGQSRDTDQGTDQSAGESTGGEDLSSDESGPAMCTPTMLVRNASIRPCHFYIDIPDVDKSTY